MNVLAAFTMADVGRIILTCLLLMILAAGGLASAGCIRVNPDPPVTVIKPVVSPHCFVDEMGMHSWGFLARNGVTVHTSDKGFANKADLIAHYAEVRNLMGTATSPTTITRAPDDKGKFRWSLYDETTGKRMEISDQPFASANAARANYDDLRQAVINCHPIDLDTLD